MILQKVAQVDQSVLCSLRPLNPPSVLIPNPSRRNDLVNNILTPVQDGERVRDRGKRYLIDGPDIVKLKRLAERNRAETIKTMEAGKVTYVYQTLRQTSLRCYLEDERTRQSFIT